MPKVFGEQISRDVIASRPTTGLTEGALFFASDTGAAYRWNGASWDAITAALHADNETPSGTVNGSNTAFTLAHAPNPAASLQFFVNGVLQAETTDFSLATDAITCVTAPETGAVLKASYRY